MGIRSINGISLRDTRGIGTLCPQWSHLMISYRRIINPTVQLKWNLKNVGRTNKYAGIPLLNSLATAAKAYYLLSKITRDKLERCSKLWNRINLLSARTLS